MTGSGDDMQCEIDLTGLIIREEEKTWRGTGVSHTEETTTAEAQSEKLLWSICISARRSDRQKEKNGGGR